MNFNPMDLIKIKEEFCSKYPREKYDAVVCFIDKLVEIQGDPDLIMQKMVENYANDVACKLEEEEYWVRFMNKQTAIEHMYQISELELIKRSFNE